MSRSRRRLNARRRLATVAILPSVIIGSTTRRNSFALGSVVVMISCLSSELVILRSIARRWLLVRLSFLSPKRWRMFLPLLFGPHSKGSVPCPRLAAGGYLSDAGDFQPRRRPVL